MTPTNATQTSFQVRTVAAVTSAAGLRMDIRSGMRQPFEDNWTLATDEPAFQGGGATAPPPLVLLASALGSCLATQIRSFSKRLHVALGSIAVDVEVRWTGHVERGRPYRAEGEAVIVDVIVESTAGLAEIRQLLAAARSGCFVDAMLAPDLVRTYRFHVGGEPFEF